MPKRTAALWSIVIGPSAVSVLRPGGAPSLVHLAYRAGEADIGTCPVTADHAAGDALCHGCR